MWARTTGALVAIAALAACASGGGPGREPDPIRAILSTDTLVFSGFDGDGDLRVSTEELEAGITREFTRADTNRDGSLQPIEFQNWSNLALGGGQTPPYRLDFDRNVDNVITQEEFTNELNARAREYDADQDGVLTRAEFVRQLNAVRPVGGPEQDGPPRRMRRPG